MGATSATLVLTLVQDVELVAPLVRHIRPSPGFLIAARLMEDPQAASRVRALVGARWRRVFGSTGEALRGLADRAGLVVFASESRSHHHRVSHALAAALPSRFLSATLQHGYECLGFLHNRAHERVAADAGFASDIVCGWFEPRQLTALRASDRAKLMTTGAPMFLDRGAALWLRDVQRGARPPPQRRQGWGWGRERRPLLVCENLQSVRLAGPPREAFLEALEFVARRSPVVLRPHPAGMFARGERKVPRGVTLDPRPIAEAELGSYGAAISPPSTVLFDLMRHDTPVALWRDRDGLVDDRLYGKLPRVTDGREWLAFYRSADDPSLVARQRDFVRGLGFPGDTAARFEALFAMGRDVANPSLDRVEHLFEG